MFPHGPEEQDVSLCVYVNRNIPTLAGNRVQFIHLIFLLENCNRLRTRSGFVMGQVTDKHWSVDLTVPGFCFNLDVHEIKADQTSC